MWATACSYFSTADVNMHGSKKKQSVVKALCMCTFADRPGFGLQVCIYVHIGQAVDMMNKL